MCILKLVITQFPISCALQVVLLLCNIVNIFDSAIPCFKRIQILKDSGMDVSLPHSQPGSARLTIWETRLEKVQMVLHSVPRLILNVQVFSEAQQHLRLRPRCYEVACCLFLSRPWFGQDESPDGLLLRLGLHGDFDSKIGCAAKDRS